MPPLRVLILGHSFIRRLGEFLALHIHLTRTLSSTEDYEIKELVTLPHDYFHVKRICVCQTSYRVSNPAFNQRQI